MEPPSPFLIDGLRTAIPARLGTTWHLQSLWQQPDDQLASFLFLPEGQKPASRGGSLKFSDGSSKLLSGHKFQDKHVSLSAGRLLLYRDVKVSKLLFSAKSTAAASCKHSGSRHRGGFSSSSSSFPLFSLFFFFSPCKRCVSRS